MKTFHRCLRGSSFVLVLALAIAAGCGKAPNPTLPTPHTPTTVKVAYPPMVAALPYIIAEEDRLFPTNAVKVEATLFTSSNDMLNSLVAGQSDLIPAISLIPIIQLEIQYPGKVRLYSHSRMSREKAIDAIIVKDESSIRTLNDLAGKKVGLFPGTSPSNLLKAFLKKKGIAADSMTLVQLAPPAQLSSLKAGAVDALFTYEPVTTTALKQGGYRQVFGSVYADLLDPCPIGASVISRDFERKHPDAAQKLVSALDQATVLQRTQPDKFRPLIEKIVKIPPEIAASVNIVDATLSTEDDTANLQRFINLLHEIGEIPEAIQAERLVAPTK